MGLYAFLTDLRRQVSGILQPAHGGTGHPHGTEWSLVRGLNSTGATIDRFNLVQLTGATNTAKVSKVTATNSTHVLGVCVGYFDGQTLVEDDCPDGHEMAVCIGGRVEILIESAVTRDEFAYSAATDGTIQSNATLTAGAFGRVVESQDTSTGATTAAVILGLPGGGSGGGGGASYATPALTLSTSNAAGSALTGIRSDATIAAFDATAPVTQAIGDSAATGSAAVASRRDHKHGMPAFATPAVVLGTAAAAGSAATLIRSDSTIAAFDATAPVTQDYGDAAATGSAAVAARRDHKHGMPNLGTSHSTAAFGDHSHGASGASIPIYFPDAPPVSPHADDDEFNDNDWTTGGVWTEFDPGTVFTPGEDARGLTMSRASSNAKWGGFYRAIPSGDWAIMTHCGMMADIPAGAQEFDVGMLLFEGSPPSGTTDFYAWALRTETGAIGRNVSLARWNQYDSFNANLLGSVAAHDTLTSDIFLRIRRISGTYFFDWSSDGMGWTESVNISSPAFTISQIGLGIWAGSARDITGYWRFWRRVASTAKGDRVLGQTLTL